MTPERWQNLTRVTNNPATDSQASWLPGDDKLVFLSNRDSDYLKLWTVSLTSGKEEPLLDLGAGVEYAMVSPDGNQVAYNFIQKGIMNVWVADLRNGQRKQLTSILRWQDFRASPRTDNGSRLK